MESNTKDLEGYIRTKKNNLKTQILRTASGALAIATILGALASCEKNVPVGPVDDSSKTVSAECIGGEEHKFEKMIEPCDDALNEVYPNADCSNVCSGDGLQRYYKCSKCGQVQQGETVVTPYKKHVPGAIINNRLFKTSECTTCNRGIVYTEKDKCWRTWIEQVL